MLRRDEGKYGREMEVLNNDLVKRHIRIKCVIRKVSQIFNILSLIKENWQPHERTTEKIILEIKMNRAWAMLQDLISEFNTNKGYNKSQISDLVNHDISIFMGNIYFSTVSNEFEEIRKKPIMMKSRSNPLCNISPGDYSIPSTDTVRFIYEPKNKVHFVNMFSTKSDLRVSMAITANYIAFKLAGEVKKTTNSRQLETHGIEHKGQVFARTRFSNIQVEIEDHNTTMLELITSQGIEPVSLLLSPFSTFTLALIEHVHKNTFFGTDRPSNVRHHAGIRKTMIELRKQVEIIQIYQTVKMIIKRCITCRKTLENYQPCAPGKVQSHYLGTLGQAFMVQFLDLLTDIKLLSFEGQKQTRHSKMITYHVFVSVSLSV